MVSDFGARLARVRERIATALARSSRPARSVTLIAVAKTFPATTVAEAAAAGLTHFGENRVQEAAAKIPAVSTILGGDRSPHVPAAGRGTGSIWTGERSLRWHLVGHLQSNKARGAVALFDLIHSVDDRDVALKLDAAAAAAGKKQAVLVQVNAAGEASKSGAASAELRALVETIRACSSLDLRGLMTIPPYDPDPERSRTYFAALREMGESATEWLSPDPYPGELSMGMSEDLEVAIEEGATLVRVGRALFGDRPRM